MLTKEETLAYIDATARQLAASGKYDNYLAIEFALRRDGSPEARAYFALTRTRQEINDLCRQGKRDKAAERN